MDSIRCHRVAATEDQDLFCLFLNYVDALRFSPRFIVIDKRQYRE